MTAEPLQLADFSRVLTRIAEEELEAGTTLQQMVEAFAALLKRPRRFEPNGVAFSFSGAGDDGDAQIYVTVRDGNERRELGIYARLDLDEDSEWAQEHLHEDSLDLLLEGLDESDAWKMISDFPCKDFRLHDEEIVPD